MKKSIINAKYKITLVAIGASIILLILYVIDLAS